MPDQDWRFQPTKLDRGYNSRSGTLAPPTISAPVTAASRIIPSPSNTNWNSTFYQNNPSSPSGTDWQKTFGQKNSFVSSPSPSSISNLPSSNSSSQPFSFSLSPSSDRSQLSLGTDTTDFYKDRAADLDLTSRDHELYGAGNDYGFND